MNQLVKEKIIPTYAVGGAIAVLWYTKALSTDDLDIFIRIDQPTSSIVSISPVLDRLKQLGGRESGVYVEFDNELPVQILADGNPLTTEAVTEALDAEYQGVPTRVFSAEHLCALALELGRDKDHYRVRLLLEQKAVDLDKLKDILTRYRLLDALRAAVPNVDR